jgi:hypothetical protein
MIDVEWEGAIVRFFYSTFKSAGNDWIAPRHARIEAAKAAQL